MYTDRVGFISYVSGERFAHAGPSEAENQWTVPCNAIYAQDIVGRSLLKLKPSCAGNGQLVDPMDILPMQRKPQSRSRFQYSVLIHTLTELPPKARFAVIC